MLSCEFRIDFGTIAAVYLGLLLFGILYNQVVEWLERRGYTEGYMSLIVAFGVAMTLAGVSMLSIQAALITLGAFAASGVPMIAGSIIRYVRKREAAQKAILEESK